MRDVDRTRRNAVEARITSHAATVVKTAMALVTSASVMQPGVYQIEPALMLKLRVAVEELDRQSRVAGRLFITRRED